MSQLEQFRLGKDEFFRDAPESPLSPAQHRAFQGLRYYAENADLVFELEAVPYPIQDVVTMPTSTGGEAVYQRWARVSFQVDGADAALTLYREPGSGHIFLPFQDANAGGETYGAGRYLEVLPLEGDHVLLDFNYAYNPYCAYNDGWSCPVSPAENRLTVPIRAGEQSFEPGH